MWKKFVIAIGMIAIVGILALAQDSGKISWVKDYDQGLKEAKESGKPIMLYFTMDG